MPITRKSQHSASRLIPKWSKPPNKLWEAISDPGPLEELVLEELLGSGPLFGLLPEALTDEFPEGLAIVLVLLLVVRAGLQGGRVVLEGEHQYLSIFYFKRAEVILEWTTKMIHNINYLVEIKKK